MKANLILRVLTQEEESIINPDGYLSLSLVIPNLEFSLLPLINVYDDDKETFMNQIQDVIINDVERLQNAIPSIKLVIDKSVIDFMPNDSEEISKFISTLVVSI